MRRSISTLSGFALLLVAGPVASATPQAVSANATAPLDQRGRDVLATLQGRGTYDRIFSAAFRQAITADQIAQVATQLSATLGRPLAVRSVTPQGASAASVEIAYERGSASFDMVLDGADPRLITGLRVTGTVLAADTAQAITDAFRALPGAAGFGVYALRANGPALVAGYRDDVAAPIASTFKLWVLSALSTSVARHERRWSDVTPLGAPATGSQVLGRWPTGSPMTLNSLATLMIAVSDNRAADTLMETVGRAGVDAAAAASGTVGPVLTTRETTALKGDPELARRWGASSEGERRRILAQEMAPTLARRGEAGLGSADAPTAIEEVEWFASPHQVARTLDGLRGADATGARAILAVNPGAAPATAQRFRYLGFKGGSEPGVISLAWLVATADGRWLAVVGNWHDASRQIDEARFVGLMDRLLLLAAAPVGTAGKTAGE